MAWLRAIFEVILRGRVSNRLNENKDIIVIKPPLDDRICRFLSNNIFKGFSVSFKFNLSNLIKALTKMVIMIIPMVFRIQDFIKFVTMKVI